MPDGKVKVQSNNFLPTIHRDKLRYWGIILASSGVVMALGMDVAVGIKELSNHNPDLSPQELIGSGLRIGRSVVGTMTLCCR